VLILQNGLARLSALRLIFQQAILPALFARKSNDADAALGALILASRAFPRVVDGYRRARARVRVHGPAGHARRVSSLRCGTFAAQAGY
jgi:hypothetical protein